MNKIEYIEGEIPKLKALIDLYNSVKWTNYTQNPSSLEVAVRNSTYIAAAYYNDELIGLVRSISDDVSIHYLQDILVHPNFQKKGIGRTLVKMALKRFEDVRSHMLLTDDEEKQIAFYKSMGYSNTREITRFPLNAFVKMKGIDLD